MGDYPLTASRWYIDTDMWFAISFLFICVLGLASKLARVERQDSIDTDALLDKIEVLERRSTGLHQRISKLEKRH